MIWAIVVLVLVFVFLTLPVCNHDWSEWRTRINLNDNWQETVRNCFLCGTEDQCPHDIDECQCQALGGDDVN